MRTRPGSAHPLGATWDGEGVNFAVFSGQATAIELCLFDSPTAAKESIRIPLLQRTNRVWHVYLPDARPGQLYGYRVFGPYAPESGQRFNPHKLLIDPYAKAIAGKITVPDEAFGYTLRDSNLDLSFDERDSAALIPKSMVIEGAFTWGDDRPPNVPWSRTLIYECHVRGMTKLHPEVPGNLRGTYLGMIADPILDHLRSLGVTAVELLPIHQAVSERRLEELGLSNYWGYNTIGFFAPDPAFATGCMGEQVNEFKTMVKTFHRAGIEVILDVVYNHTGEGNQLGPTICFRGFDNAAYYRLVPHEARHHVDFTGCGNSINVLHPRSLQLILDSLRYWVTEMHVDGFRFDLAPTLARDPYEFDGFSRFLALVQQDPTLSRVKLIAEPWDVGPGGYRLGAFPPGWAEWNGRYRDCVRRFWRGDEGQVPEMASRLSGSSDIFQGSDRGPYASINFITCHDGYSLHDLVSYEQKHNEANAEDNRDGANDNWSRNWGAEGETKAQQVIRLRDRMKKNLIATLAFSQGVPMISHGDEIGRTQGGNNNAYCQDNPISWVNWDLDERAVDLLNFTREVLRITKSNPVFRRHRFFAGDPVSDKGFKDVMWLRSDGAELTIDDWGNSRNHLLGMLIPGDASDDVDERGRPNRGQTLLLLLNASNRARHFTMPTIPTAAASGTAAAAAAASGHWQEVINTAQQTHRVPKGGGINVAPHSLVLLCYVVA